MTVNPRHTFRDRQSLHYRVIGAVSLIVLFTIIFIAVGVTYLVYQIEQTAWQSRQDEAARNAAHTTNTFISQVQNYLTLVGVIQRSYLETNPQAMADLLRQNQALLEVIRLDSDGEIFASAFQEDAPVLTNLFTIPQSNWFQQARSGRPYVGDLQISARNKPYIILALPTPDGGVVSARLSMGLLWEVVEASRFGKSGQVYIVDSYGHLVAHPDQRLVLNHTNLGGRPEIDSVLASPGYIWTGTYQNFEGQDVIGSTMPISIGNWVIFAEISGTEARSSTVSAVIILGGGVLIFGIFTILVTNLVLRRLVLNPIKDLRDGAQRIGQGDLDHRIMREQFDEVGQVAEAFNEMADNLKKRETELAEARDEALAASRLKSQLLANVSHDLRTPLNAILGHTEMLQQGMYGSLSDNQLGITQRVIHNTQNLTGMVKKLMDQARLEAGSLNLEAVPFAPPELVDGIESAMSEVARKKGLELSYQVDADVPATISGDFNWLLQILVNLVENALKFTEQGSVQVHIFRPDDTHWAMEVSDTGPGIPIEARSYIFEAFHQVDGTATRKQGGSGLGLSIVKQIITLMEGEVILESEPGRGSTFTVLLPLIPVQETIP